MASTLGTALSILRGRETRATVAFGPGASFGSFGGALGSGMTLGGAGVQLSLSDHERSFAGLAVAYRCVTLIAQNLASIDLMVMTGETPVAGDPFAEVFNQGTPDAPYSARVVKEVLYARAEVQGEAFAYLDRDGVPTSPVRGVHPIYDPVQIVVGYVQDRTNGRLIPRLLGFTVKLTGGGYVDLLPEEVLWLRYPHPTQQWGALAPWKAALYAAEADAYARKWQTAMLRQDARPSMIVNAGTVPADRWDQLSAQWTARVQGPNNAGKSLLVSSSTPIDAKPLTFTPAEMAYLESRKANADEIMLAFGVRRDVLFGESTYENQAAAKTALWSETLLPKLDTMASEIDRQVMPDARRTVAWDLSDVDALRESQNALIKRASDAAYPDILMIDELRATLGYDPLPGGIGQRTLTAYREHVRLQAQADFLPLLGATPGRNQAQVVLVRHRGRTRAIRREVEQARADEASTLQAYDRLERIGVQAIARLAARQEQAVLREVKKLNSPRFADRLTGWAQRVAAGGWPQRMLVERGLETTVTRALIPDGERAMVDDVFDGPFWTRETVRALEDFMAATWMEGGQRAASAFGADWDVLDPRVMDAMAARLDVLADELTATTRSVLESQILQAGVAEGESIDALAERLRTVFTDLSTWRAKVIARTEVVGGYNGAAHTVATESGVVSRRTWLATGDGRTRASHRAQNGHTLDKLNERYPNGCLYPADPSADPSETVNCRCVELFDVTDPD